MEDLNQQNKNMPNQETESRRELIEVPGIVTYPVGNETVSAITKVAGDEAIGNTLVRTCPIFEDKKAEFVREGNTPAEANKMAVAFCLGDCASRGLTIETNGENDIETRCPEKNTLDALTRLGIKPEQAIIVAVTGNNVGFSDEFEKYETEGTASTNPEGWRQFNGCNAFFSDVEECPALACRLADCGDLNVEFKTKDGRNILGFLHMTRPNQYGQTKYPDNQDNLPYVEFALRKAFNHYGEVDLSSVRLVLRTAIEKKDFIFRFDAPEKMEQVLPGWAVDGYVENQDNASWKPGDGFESTDRFTADFRGIVEDSIKLGMDRLGIEASQFDDSHMLDTMHSGEHSSFERSKNMNTTDTRDLYITAHKSAFAL